MVQVRLMKRMRRAISLLMIDIDHFKSFNDQLGHPAADELLRAVAKLLIKGGRSSDIAARYGGEEFAIILPDTPKAGAIGHAKALALAIRSHSWDQGPLTTSVGVSTQLFNEVEVADATEQGQRLVYEADRALYRSKSDGRDRATHFADIATDKTT